MQKDVHTSLIARAGWEECGPVYERRAPGMNANLTGQVLFGHRFEEPQPTASRFGTGEDVFIEAQDGRIVALHVMGPPDGVPIFYIAGNPGSRLGPHVNEHALYTLHTRLIAIDRPGLGETTRRPGLSVLETAYDIEDAANELGIRRFAIVARSGGTPTAMAAAALMGDRVGGMLLAAPIAPYELAAFANGMTPSNQEDYGLAQHNPTALYERYREQAARLHDDYYSLMGSLLLKLKGGDLQLEGSHLRLIARGHEAGVADGLGWADSSISFLKPWGFNLKDIKSPTRLWHCHDDPFVAVTHAQMLASEIPNAVLWHDPDTSHMSLAINQYRCLEQARNLFMGPRRIRLIQLLAQLSMPTLPRALSLPTHWSFDKRSNELTAAEREEADRWAKGTWQRPSPYGPTEVALLRKISTASHEELAASYPEYWED